MIPTLAIFDIETTGLFTSRHDRIVEIAVIRMTHHGEVLDEFVSLVNPERDIGPTSIHGLESSDILDAPTFAELAGELCERFDGTTVLAGHNVRFDQQFLRSEFARIGVDIPDFPVLCTMSLSGGGSLAECCSNYGIEFDGERHSALHDTRATSGLLRCFLGKSGGAEDGVFYIDRPEPLDLRNFTTVRWPLIRKGNRSPVTRQHAGSRAQNNTYLQRLNQLKPNSIPQNSDEMAYSALLERVLEDRRIDESESDLLIQTASEWGLSRESVSRVHEDFLRRLVIAALVDGIVTDAERRDLNTIVRLLGLNQEMLNSQLEQAAARLRSATRAVAPSNDLTGKSVCFTGELQCKMNGNAITREQAQLLAAAAGLQIANSVTRSLDILVVADPNTQSGKAKKARDYGTRIIAEVAFWNLIGVSAN